jgi:hypothetical protein
MPRITYSSVSKPQPDRLEDAIELARQAGKLIGRHGAECRLLGAQTAGEATGTFVFTIEFESVEKYAKQIEEIDADTEVRDLQVNMTRSSSPIVTLSTALSNELPLAGTRKKGRGSVIEVHMLKAATGRFDNALQDLGTVATLVEKVGAVNVQAFTLTAAGMLSGAIGISIEWPSVGAQAKSGLIWESDPQGAALMAGMLNGTSSSTLLSSAIYRDVPL